MAERIVNVDPTIYGGSPRLDQEVPDFAPPAQPGAAAGQPYSPPDKVENNPNGGAASTAVGENAIAYNSRELASYGDSAKAAVKSWTTTRVLDWINMPHFDAEPNFDVKPYVNNAPVFLDDTEHKFLSESRSPAEFNYRLKHLEDQTAMYKTMGDHPVLSSIVSMADPVYFAIDAASLGAGWAVQGITGAARVGRITAAAGSMAATYAAGKIEQTQTAKSDAEIIGMALLNGAAAGAFYSPRTKKMEVHDTSYPSDSLGQAAAAITNKETGAERRIVSEQAEVAAAQPKLREGVDDVTPATATKEAVPATVSDDAVKVPLYSGGKPITREWLRDQAGVQRTLSAPTDAYTYLLRHENDPEFGPMIRQLRSEQPDTLAGVKVWDAEFTPSKKSTAGFFEPNTNQVFINANMKNQGMTALHEVIHSLTSYKIKYGMANPGSAHGEIVRQLEALRVQVQDYIKKNPIADKEQAHFAKYLSSNPSEFVAGLYGGVRGGLAEALSKIPVAGAPNALSKMVGIVRKLLGLPPSHESALTKALGLTEQLMNTKLDVKVGGTGETIHLLKQAPGGTPTQVRQGVAKLFDNAGERTGNKIEWSLHKTMSGYGTEGKRVADTLVDSPTNMRPDSAVSQRQAIRSDLAAHQYAYEDELKKYLSEQGAGLLNRILRPAESSAIQRRVERQVYDELMRRENAVRRGGNIVDPNVDARISRLADLHDTATARGLKEMQDAGVLGADAVTGGAGYASRKWSVTAIDDMENRLLQTGLTQRQARRAMRDFVADKIQRANPSWERELAEDVSGAILERARRKGYFDDSSFRGHIGNGGAAQVRDILESSGVPQSRVQRVLDVLTAVTDEQNKTPSLKHRIAIDMTHQSEVVPGVVASATDFVDTNLTRNLDQYLDNAAGQAALARKNLTNATDIANLRREFLHGITDEMQRKTAADLFDNTIASLKGNPVGEAVPTGLRRLQDATQMVGLASSGLWQITEYATAMQRYGAVKTFREALRSMPVLRDLMGEIAGSSGNASSLERILTRNSYQDIRMRPYLHRMEDNFETSLGDHIGMAAQQAKQVVPYLNAMKYVHHHQAELVGNLVADVFHKAALGDAKAAKVLEQYGLEGHVLGSIRSDIQAHGLNTELWSDATWQQVRGPLAKMMDESVLRNRTGEIPAFAQFSTTGKFIFTFRSFLLGSHNKLLAGSLGRQGFGGLALLMAYQFPLTMLASAANSAVRGKPETDPAKLAATSITQMSAMGLAGELFGVISGQKQQFGSSGLMLIDRMYKVGSQVGQGNLTQAGASLTSAIPLLALIPGMKLFAEQFKN